MRQATLYIPPTPLTFDAIWISFEIFDWINLATGLPPADWYFISAFVDK